MTIPVIPQKSRKGKLFEPLATTCSTTTSGTCCICAQQHSSNRWKKRSFILTELGIKLASVMMERNLVGNICCNSSYVVLYNYYHTEEGKKKVDALKLTNQKQTKPNRTKFSPTESNTKQLRITKLVPILPKSTEIVIVSTFESPLDLLHNQVEKDFASQELTQKERRENSLLNINDPSGTSNHHHLP